MDFLGLRTLTVIRDAEAAIQKKDPDPSPSRKLDYDDAATYKMLGRVRPRACSSSNPRV